MFPGQYALASGPSPPAMLETSRRTRPSVGKACCCARARHNHTSMLSCTRRGLITAIAGSASMTSRRIPSTSATASLARLAPGAGDLEVLSRRVIRFVLCRNDARDNPRFVYSEQHIQLPVSLGTGRLEPTHKILEFEAHMKRRARRLRDGTLGKVIIHFASKDIHQRAIIGVHKNIHRNQKALTTSKVVLVVAGLLRFNKTNRIACSVNGSLHGHIRSRSSIRNSRPPQK